MSSLDLNKKSDIDLENEEILPKTKEVILEDESITIGEIYPSSNNNNCNTEGSNNTDNSASTSTNVKDDLEEGMQYRLRMKNIPRYASVKMIKNLLAKNDCGNLNVKKSPKWNYCFVQLKVNASCKFFLFVYIISL